MARTPHYQNDLKEIWIMSKSTFSFCFWICCCGFLSIFPNCHFFYSCKGLPSPTPMGFFFFSTEDLQLSPSWNFMLLLYVKAETKVMASMISPPSIKNHVKYDPSIRSLVDDEAIE